MVLESFKPKVVSDSYGTMLVELSICYICKKKMVASPEKRRFGQGTFPAYHMITFESQLKSAGWEELSSVCVDNNSICKSCNDSGKATFQCSLCADRKTTDMIESSFGDPPEYLCNRCYETVPAKKWAEMVSKITKEHMHDFD